VRIDFRIYQVFFFFAREASLSSENFTSLNEEVALANWRISYTLPW